MAEQSLAVQIIEAIKSEDCEKILKLFTENPEQKDFYTFFGSQTWLGYAAQTGKLNSVKALIDIGLEVNLGDKRDKRQPICSAAANNHYEIVDYLLKKGANLDVSASVRNPLFSSIVGKSEAIVSLLLEAGTDSKVRYNSKTMKNMDAVAFALMRGEKKSARLIAIWNADGDEEVANKALEEAALIAAENAK